ncbi:MAG: hypothetical protein ACREX8_00220 [Gammaproteobacteria bacterium]
MTEPRVRQPRAIGRHPWHVLLADPARGPDLERLYQRAAVLDNRALLLEQRVDRLTQAAAKLAGVADELDRVATGLPGTAADRIAAVVTTLRRFATNPDDDPPEPGVPG